jgi:hypothetical protein
MTASMVTKTVVANWMTTIPGIAALLVGISHLLVQWYSKGTIDTNMVSADITAIIAGFGLVAAKDVNKQ